MTLITLKKSESVNEHLVKLDEAEEVTGLKRFNVPRLVTSKAKDKKDPDSGNTKNRRT